MKNNFYFFLYILFFSNSNLYCIIDEVILFKDTNDLKENYNINILHNPFNKDNVFKIKNIKCNQSQYKINWIYYYSEKDDIYNEFCLNNSNFIFKNNFTFIIEDNFVIALDNKNFKYDSIPIDVNNIYNTNNSNIIYLTSNNKTIYKIEVRNLKYSIENLKNIKNLNNVVFWNEDYQIFSNSECSFCFKIYNEMKFIKQIKSFGLFKYSKYEDDIYFINTEYNEIKVKTNMINSNMNQLIIKLNNDNIDTLFNVDKYFDNLKIKSHLSLIDYKILDSENLVVLLELDKSIEIAQPFPFGFLNCVLLIYNYKSDLVIFEKELKLTFQY